LKDLQQWKEAPLDCVVLSLYQLQAFYSNEIKRGLAGLGQYTLSPGYSSLATDCLGLDYIPTNTPEEIVQAIAKHEVLLPEVEKVQWHITIPSVCYCA
jgi:hypothetical protein